MHHFPGMSEHTLLWKTTYTNLSMYLAAIPRYDSGGEEETGKAPVVPAGPVRKEDRQALQNFFKRT